MVILGASGVHLGCICACRRRPSPRVRPPPPIGRGNREAEPPPARQGPHPRARLPAAATAASGVRSATARTAGRAAASQRESRPKSRPWLPTGRPPRLSGIRVTSPAMGWPSHAVLPKGHVGSPVPFRSRSAKPSLFGGRCLPLSTSIPVRRRAAILAKLRRRPATRAFARRLHTLD